MPFLSSVFLFPFIAFFSLYTGVVGWCEGLVYLTSTGRQTDIGYSWARPQVRIELGGCFYFFCFFTFSHSLLSTQFVSFISSTIDLFSFLPFSGRRYKMTHKGLRVVKPKHNAVPCYQGWLKP